MKTTKTILFAIILSFLFTFCVNKKSEKNSERNFTDIELIGKWNQVDTDESIKDKDSKIESIQLVNDSIAEIQLINSTGERILIGKWEIGYEKESENLGLGIKSDLKITYYPDNQNMNILLLKVYEEDEKIIMSGNKLRFEKE